MTIVGLLFELLRDLRALYRKVTDCDHRNGNKIGRYAIDIQFTGMIILAVRTIWIRTLYYRGSDIAYKFLRARHYVPRDINGALKRDVIRT